MSSKWAKITFSSKSRLRNFTIPWHYKKSLSMHILVLSRRANKYQSMMTASSRSSLINKPEAKHEDAKIPTYLPAFNIRPRWRSRHIPLPLKQWYIADGEGLYRTPRIIDTSSNWSIDTVMHSTSINFPQRAFLIPSGAIVRFIRDLASHCLLTKLFCRR